MKNKLRIITVILLAVLLFATPVFAEGEEQVNYGLLSLIPPIIIIALAFITKNVVLSLFIGVLLGATMINQGNVFFGFLRTCDTYILGEATDSWNAALVIFIFGTGGLISLMMKMGGTQAIAESLSKKAKNSKSCLLITWFLGLIIFFEDIANNLIIGPTMRPITDKMNISREKLSYVIDSTAAPVTDMALISSWVAYEISMIKNSFDAMGVNVNAYDLFVKSIPYRFYNIFALIMVLILILLQRDYGPMYEAEKRARTTGKVLADGATPMMSEELEKIAPKKGVVLKKYNAIIPILVLVFTIIGGLWYNGGGINEPFTMEGIRNSFGNADASVVILWSVLITSIVTGIMAVAQKIMTVGEAINLWINGAKELFITNVILILAWSAGSLMSDMGTANYIVSFVGSSIPEFLLPAILFLIACFVAFSTGTCFGTTGIMMPIAIPLVMSYTKMEVNYLTIAVIGAVTSGAIFGDHCSPISDTTIMASMGAGSDHIDHVKTQLPYALTTAGVATLVGYILAALKVNPIISYIIGIAVLVAIVKFIGKPVEELELTEHR